MRNHSLFAVLASALLLFGLCTAKTNPGSPEVLTRISQMLEDLSDRVKSAESGLRELKKSMGNDTLKNIDEGFQKMSKNLMSCAPEQLMLLLWRVKDECKDYNRCSRHALCKDTLFGYNCTCLPGYAGDGFTCEEIDECSTGVHECLDGARCENLDGAYDCHCVYPAVGDGRNYCFMPECKDVEGLGCILPVHKRMDFQSAIKNCENEGGRLIEGVTTIEQLDTLKYSYEYEFEYQESKPNHHDVWVGIQQGKWISDGTPVDRSFWTDHPLSHVGDEECTVVALQLDPVSYWSENDCTIKLPSFCIIP